MIARLLVVELRKLNASLALLLAVAAPALMGLLALLGTVTLERAPAWGELLGEMTFTLWVFFLLPMTTAAFTVLVAQIEYRGRAWDHLLALPVRRWQVFAVKAFVVMAAVLLMTALVFVFAAAGGLLGGLIKGRAPTGEIPWAQMAEAVPKVAASATLFVALQLWAALRFASFVPPLAFGIGGTLVSLAVLVTRTDKADWFPWLLPFNVIRKPDPWPYLWLGALGGVAVLVVMVIDLSRREMR